MLIIDVREPDEYLEAHVAQAINLPLSRFDSDWSSVLAEVNKDSLIVLYCRSGQRSAIALNKLHQKGFTNLSNGINQLKVETDYSLYF